MHLFTLTTVYSLIESIKLSIFMSSFKIRKENFVNFVIVNYTQSPYIALARM